jgi:hypothetical protein
LKHFHKIFEKQRTTLPTALVKPWHVLLLVHNNADPIPYRASLYDPAEILEESEMETQGYSSAAIVPAGVPGTAGTANVATLEHFGSV